MLPASGWTYLAGGSIVNGGILEPFYKGGTGSEPCHYFTFTLGLGAQWQWFIQLLPLYEDVSGPAPLMLILELPFSC
ncbi:MAG: hypothetical protein IPQ08_13035 [Chitinophagaceae bacterium]|nr:hypothetical protein [Chitinophagaceae bacterium]